MSAHRPSATDQAPDSKTNARSNDGGTSEFEALDEHPWFASILDLFGYGPADVDPRVHRADEMLEQAMLEHGGDLDAGIADYVSSGAQIARTVESFVRAQWGDSFDPSWSLLDFGCGYGRATRFFARSFGTERIWASDLLDGAIHFQRDVLGVHSFASHAVPSKVHWPRECFDLIYVGSLFTHLPRTTFDAWLEELFRRLSSDGVLLFSVHDLRLKPSGVAVDADGFAFVESSESREIDHAVYGSTWLGASALRRALGELARCVGERLSWRRYPRALGGYQDLVAVSRRPLAAQRLGCIGQIDDARLEGDKHGGRFTVRVDGWSLVPGCDQGVISKAGDEVETATEEAGEADPPGPLRPVIEIHLIGENSAATGTQGSPERQREDLADEMRSLRARPIAAGWRLELALPQRLRRGRDLLFVTMKGVEGSEPPCVLYGGTLDRLLLNRAQEHFRLRRDRVYELAETIEQIKQSRFWRARTVWFRIKRALGLTEESATGPDLRPEDRRP